MANILEVQSGIYQFSCSFPQFDKHTSDGQVIPMDITYLSTGLMQIDQQGLWTGRGSDKFGLFYTEGDTKSGKLALLKWYLDGNNATKPPIGYLLERTRPLSWSGDFHHCMSDGVIAQGRIYTFTMGHIAKDTSQLSIGVEENMPIINRRRWGFIIEKLPKALQEADRSYGTVYDRMPTQQPTWEQILKKREEMARIDPFVTN